MEEFGNFKNFVVFSSLEEITTMQCNYFLSHKKMNKGCIEIICQIYYDSMGKKKYMKLVSQSILTRK